LRNYCKLTVVTTTRNNSQDLIATAKSIREQSSRNFEWLVYDGSDQKDELLRIQSIVDATVTDGVPYVRFVHHLDNGIYEAMNNAVTLCNGDFTIFLNCGDMFVQETTTDMIEAALVNNIDVLHGDEIYIASDNTVILKTGTAAKELWEGFREGLSPYLDNMVCQQAIVYRTSVLRDNPMSMAFRVAADHDYFFDLYKKGYHFSYVNKPFCIYFAGGFSFQHPLNCYFDWVQVQEKYSNIVREGSTKSILKPFSRVFRGTLNFALYQKAQLQQQQAFNLLIEAVDKMGQDAKQAEALDRASGIFVEYIWELYSLEFWVLTGLFADLLSRVAPADVVNIADVHLAVLQILDRIQSYDDTKLTAYEVKLTSRLVTGAARLVNAAPRPCVNGSRSLDTGNLDGGTSSVLSASQVKKVREMVGVKHV